MPIKTCLTWIITGCIESYIYRTGLLNIPLIAKYSNGYSINVESAMQPPFLFLMLCNSCHYREAQLNMTALSVDGNQCTSSGTDPTDKVAEELCNTHTHARTHTLSLSVCLCCNADLNQQRVLFTRSHSWIKWAWGLM